MSDTLPELEPPASVSDRSRFVDGIIDRLLVGGALEALASRWLRPSAAEQFASSITAHLQPGYGGLWDPEMDVVFPNDGQSGWLEPAGVSGSFGLPPGSLFEPVGPQVQSLRPGSPARPSSPPRTPATGPLAGRLLGLSDPLRRWRSLWGGPDGDSAAGVTPGRARLDLGVPDSAGPVVGHGLEGPAEGRIEAREFAASDIEELEGDDLAVRGSGSPARLEGARRSPGPMPVVGPAPLERALARRLLAAFPGGISVDALQGLLRRAQDLKAPPRPRRVGVRPGVDGALVRPGSGQDVAPPLSTAGLWEPEQRPEEPSLGQAGARAERATAELPVGAIPRGRRLALPGTVASLDLQLLEAMDMWESALPGRVPYHAPDEAGEGNRDPDFADAAPALPRGADGPQVEGLLEALGLLGGAGGSLSPAAANATLDPGRLSMALVAPVMQVIQEVSRPLLKGADEGAPTAAGLSSADKGMEEADTTKLDHVAEQVLDRVVRLMEIQLDRRGY